MVAAGASNDDVIVAPGVQPALELRARLRGMQ